MNKTVIKIMAALAIVTTLFSGFPVQAAITRESQQ